MSLTGQRPSSVLQVAEPSRPCLDDPQEPTARVAAHQAVSTHPLRWVLHPLLSSKGGGSARHAKSGSHRLHLVLAAQPVEAVDAAQHSRVRRRLPGSCRRCSRRVPGQADVQRPEQARAHTLSLYIPHNTAQRCAAKWKSKGSQSPQPCRSKYGHAAGTCATDHAGTLCMHAHLAPASHSAMTGPGTMSSLCTRSSRPMLGM